MQSDAALSDDAAASAHACPAARTLPFSARGL